MTNMNRFLFLSAAVLIMVLAASLAARRAHAQASPLVVPSCPSTAPTGTPAGNGNVGPFVVDPNGNLCIINGPVGLNSPANSVSVVISNNSVMTQSVACPANPISKKIPPLC